MYGQVEVTWQTLRTIEHSIMVHARVSDKFIHLALMYTTDHIFTVIPIKHLLNQDGEPIIPHKLATGTKTSVSILCVLFFPCVVRKATAHVDTNALKICHPSQKGFWGIFVGIPQHQKGYFIYSHDVVFDKIFSSALEYTSHQCSEALTMQPGFLYITYNASSHDNCSIPRCPPSLSFSSM